MKKYWPLLAIFFLSLLYYLPILQNSDILTNRGNDLSEFFYPIFYFVKENLIKYHQLPFWNNLFFSGTPLLPDPQSPLYYLPNIIFLFIKSINEGFVISIFLHIFISGLGMYELAKKGFKLSRTSSLFCSLLYIVTPKLSGYIEAGHFGLITSWAWLPFVFLLTILLARKPSLNKTILLAIFLSLIFYSHVLIFVITATALSCLYFYNRRNPIYLFYTAILTFGLISITFIPQLSWQKETTRNLLLTNPDIYPKWLTKTEFIKASISPIFFGSRFIWSLDTEKTTAIGLVTTFFALLGFLKIKLRNKFFLSLVIILVTLISLNNISPIYNLLAKMNWFILFRVSTRFWFLIVFVAIILAGIGFESLRKYKIRKFALYTIALLAIVELLVTSWTKILKPVQISPDMAPKEIYEFLSQDKTKFRVFCLNRCLSQKESAIYGLELADGYGTLQQMNYYIFSQQLAQAYWRNRYSLSIPPFEIYHYEDFQPYSPNLASYNIKYIISDHPLKNKDLLLIKKIDKYLIYENQINLPRSNYPITVYTPNFIQVDTTNYKENFILLSEVYNQDWVAYTNGTDRIDIQETGDATRKAFIKSNSKYVDFVYDPLSYKAGLLITGSTLIFIIGAIIVKWKFKK